MSIETDSLAKLARGSGRGLGCVGPSVELEIASRRRRRNDEVPGPAWNESLTVDM